MVLSPAGAVAHQNRDQAHPAPGSIAELEAAYGLLCELRVDDDYPELHPRRTRALDVACRVLYREIVQRSATSAETAAARHASLVRLGLVVPLTESEHRAIDGNR